LKLLRLKVGARLILSILAVVLAVVATMAVVVGIRMQNVLADNGETIAAETARHWSSIIDADIEVPLDEARSLGRVFESMINSPEVTVPREQADAMLKYFIEDYEEILGVYVAFEPDAFDGLDGEYADTFGHDETGRYIPYWTRDSTGAGVVEALLSYEVAGDGDYYQLPKTRNRECIIDPYLYPVQGVEVMITSLVVPVRDNNGSFRGIAGIDLSLDAFQGMVSGIEIHGFPSAYVSFYSAAGTVLASKNTAIMGKTIDELVYEPEFMDALVSNGEFYVARHSNLLDKPVRTFGAEIAIGTTGTNWRVVVSIPEDELFLATRQTTVLLVAIGLGAAVLAIFAALLIARSISRPIQLITQGAQRLAEGDIALNGIDKTDIEQINRRSDELGDIGKAFANLIVYMDEKANIAQKIAAKDLNVEASVSSSADALGKSLEVMVGSLTDFMRQADAAVGQVSGGADQVAQSSQSLSQGAAEQASSLEEISSSINEINSQSRQNAANSSEANTLAKDAVSSAKTGNEQVKELMTAMEGINASADEIGKVVKVIDDIAFQINLLALNANVEAARAGKYGKGFAVVADEVRNLAVRSAEAVKETTGMVEETVRNIEKGDEATGATASQLESIVGGIDKVAALLGEITSASEEQASGIDQITSGLEQIDQVTQSNTASAEESASASQELATQAQQIKSLIGEYSIEEQSKEGVPLIGF
jgi:methyl-accepting chemotaxis protein